MAATEYNRRMPTRRGFLGSLFAAHLASGAPTNPADYSVTEALAQLRGGNLTPTELVDACLQRIEERNPRLNAFITVLADTARAHAKALRRGDAASQPLHGIPIALKDLYDTAGARTTAASAQWRHRVPPQDAEVVRRLRTAGAVITGKANMDEFAYNFTSETSAFGAAHNPWKHGYSPGGSSGGSGIAIAAGMSLAALGSDTGGSIRLPAAFCGITGFKPTYERVPLDGVAPLSWSLDHPGPMTRTALDAALLHGVLADTVFTLLPVTNVRIGLPRALFFQDLEPEVERALQNAAEVLRRICREVRDVQLPRIPLNADSPLPAPYTVVIFAEAYAFHREMLAADPDSYHSGTRASIELGKPIDAATYIHARREMDLLRASAKEMLFGDADLLLTPTSPGVAFPLGSNPSLVYLRNTAPWNLYGVPTISIPCGFGKGGLPVGMQITGPPGADDLVLSAAAAYQAETDFHRQRPTLAQ